MHHLVSPIRMCYFHLVAVSLLLTCLTNAYDENIFTISPCDEIHQKIVQLDYYYTVAAPNTRFIISLNDTNCKDANYKLSLLLLDKLSAINCNENTSLGVNYITSENDNKTKDSWGCTGTGTYHYGDQDMHAIYTLDNAKEFTVWRNGAWGSQTGVKLVAAAYFDSESTDCGKYFDCTKNKGCSHKENTKGRCISEKLKCDDYPSCGMECNEDESNEVCHADLPRFDWGDFQYIVTTFLAALFFILSPTVIVFLLFYRKRMRLQELQRRVQLEREVRAARERSTVLTISSRLNDNPPTYDDVHETKEPPPCFCAAVALNNAINQDKAAEAESQITSESSTEIKFDCTCKV